MKRETREPWEKRWNNIVVKRCEILSLWFDSSEGGAYHAWKGLSVRKGLLHQAGSSNKKRTKEERELSTKCFMVIWKHKLICHFKEIKIQVLHRWNVLISEGIPTLGSFVELICARAMIDSFQFSSGNVRERLRRQIEGSANVWILQLISFVMVRLIGRERYKWSSTDEVKGGRRRGRRGIWNARWLFNEVDSHCYQ